MKRRGGFSRAPTQTWARLPFASPGAHLLVIVSDSSLMKIQLTLLTIVLDHFGVVKAFLDEDLLPRVVSGTSAGGLVAALMCTRTDAELKELLVPQLADRITACEEPFNVWFRRFWTTGARFDSVAWAKKVSCES